MAWTTNNYELGLSLTVLDTTYSILDAFGSYPALSDSGYLQLPEVDRSARVEALYVHLSAQLGINVKDIVLPEAKDRRINTAGVCYIRDFYDIVLSSDYGTLTGAGRYEANTPITIETILNEPRTFTGWRDLEINAIISTNKKLAFTVTRNRWLKAEYEAYKRVTVQVESNDLSKGTVSGGGEVYQTDNVIVLAHPIGANKISHWIEKDTGATATVAADGTYRAMRDVTLVAQFYLPQKPVSYVSAKMQIHYGFNPETGQQSEYDYIEMWANRTGAGDSTLNVFAQSSPGAIYIEDFYIQPGQNESSRIVRIYESGETSIHVSGFGTVEPQFPNHEDTVYKYELE